MSEVKKIATRESYGNALAELGKEFDNLVVLDADLAAATKTGIFKKAFPERHIDCGIAECNMMGVAAGLATTGKVPFASSFAAVSTSSGNDHFRFALFSNPLYFIVINKTFIIYTIRNDVIISSGNVGRASM